MGSPGLQSTIRAVVREPLVHFLLLGAAIYGVYFVAGSGARDADPNRIVVTAGEVGWLAESFEKRWSRPPTPAERDGLIAEYVRETVLYREALAMGLDRQDTIIRRRLAQKLEFLSQDLVASVPPTLEELQDYFEERADRYAAPALTTFTHVFVDPARRGDETPAHAAGIGAELRALEPPTEDATAFSDPFMLQAYYPERSEAEIAKLFGSEFGQSVSTLEPGAWHGPLRSGYGLHFVYVDRRSPRLEAEFAAVRDRVERDWQDARRERVDTEFYQSLRARYDVVIEDPAADSRYAAAPAATP